MTTAAPGRRPLGRDDVMAAVVDAAADLFASKGPAATSIREVAARAGVNHGLVYRHFGTKESLVAAVLNHLSDAGAAGTGDRVDDRHWRVLARAILDGYPVGQLQRRFPTVQSLVATTRRSYRDEAAAELAAGHVVALTLGWQLFEPFIRSAAGLDDLDPETVQAAVRDLNGRLLRGRDIPGRAG